MNKISSENAVKLQGNDDLLADDREIFENAENHEPLENTTIPTIVEQPPTPLTEDVPPPLPPRPPHRSPLPSPQAPSKLQHTYTNVPTRELPAEPAVPAFENISDTDSLSERSSQGRQPLNIEDLISYMSRVGKKGIHKEYEDLRSLPPTGTFESTL